jgi:hypothetical protein
MGQSPLIVPEEAALGSRKTPRSRGSLRRSPISKARLKQMSEEATVDAYGESELVGGFHAMLDEHLAMPFETTLLGLAVTVKRVDITERNEIVAICSRGRLRQAIPVLDLVLPSPAPAGAEWIEAYRLWAGRR